MEPLIASPLRTNYENTLHDIPLDIARLIFERAMETTPMPVHLALVSKQIQNWVEPFIYRHLVFRNRSQFRNFYRTFRERRFSISKPPEFYARNVKSLYITSKACIRKEKVYAIMKCLTGLRAVASWDLHWGKYIVRVLVGQCKERGVLGAKSDNVHGSSLDGGSEKELDNGSSEGQEGEGQQKEGDGSRRRKRRKEEERDMFAYKELKRISLSAYALTREHVDLRLRAFRDITHLDIYFNRTFNWMSLLAMENLRYLTMDLLTLVGARMSIREMCVWMECIIAICRLMKDLKVVVFACVDHNNADFDLRDKDGSFLLPWNLEGESTSGSTIGRPLLQIDEVDPHTLHYLTQVSLGIRDPRVILGIASCGVPNEQLLRDYMVSFVYPVNTFDWDFNKEVGTRLNNTVYEDDEKEEVFRESWDVAEEIVVKRKKEFAWMFMDDECEDNTCHCHDDEIQAVLEKRRLGVFGNVARKRLMACGVIVDSPNNMDLDSD